MLNSRHRSPTLVSGLPMAAMASRSLAGVTFGLRPPLRPRARAEASPARARSEMRSRSNSASEAKMPKTVQGTMVGETEPEVDGALHTVVSALAHPIMRSAAGVTASHLRRETPVLLRQEDGTLIEGVV